MKKEVVLEKANQKNLKSLIKNLRHLQSQIHNNKHSVYKTLVAYGNSYPGQLACYDIRESLIPSDKEPSAKQLSSDIDDMIICLKRDFKNKK